MNIRVMTIEDFDQVHALWMSIKGFGIRSVDDSKEGVERFLKRNPTTSVVAEEDGKIVGAILCGHDGRRGCLYHVCVREDCRIPLPTCFRHNTAMRSKAAKLPGEKASCKRNLPWKH